MKTGEEIINQIKNFFTSMLLSIIQESKGD
jgi:hypothetical protein